jgi:hypothetical protein
MMCKILALIVIIMAVEQFADGWSMAQRGGPLTCSPNIISAYAYGLGGGK